MTAIMHRAVISVASPFGIQLWRVGAPDRHVQPSWGQRVGVGENGRSTDV